MQSVRNQRSGATKTIPALDGLRGLAVLMVIWLHTPPVSGVAILQFSARLAQAVKAGYLGVDLFFVLSGYLITNILLAEQAETGSISLRNFYIKRMLRIFPIYYLSVAAGGVILFHMNFVQLASHLLFLQNYYPIIGPAITPLDHTWSLAVEEQFYLVWPWLMLAVPLAWGGRITGLVIPGMSLLAAALLIRLAPHDMAQDLLYGATPVRVVSLSLGAYLAFRQRVAAPWPVLSGGIATLAGTAGVALVAAMHARGWLAGGDYFRTFSNFGLSVVAMGLLAIVIAPVASWSVPFRWLLSTAPLRYLGRISYGLYLYHYIFFAALGMREVDEGQTVPLRPVLEAVFGSLALAIISHDFLEAPLIRWGRRALLSPPRQAHAEVQGAI